MVTSLDSPVVESAKNYRMSPREVLTFISAVMALTALAIDLMLPAFSDIREAFDLGEDSNGRIAALRLATRNGNVAGLEAMPVMSTLKTMRCLR